jgi:hypothetical protein
LAQFEIRGGLFWSSDPRGCFRGYTRQIKTAIRRKLKEGRTLEIFDTQPVHDRYIFKNNVDGRMLGTSFGGFGNKIFTILPLPREDPQKLLAGLRVIERGD